MNLSLLVLLGLLVPLGGYFLMAACNTCGAEAPSFRKSVLISTFVAAAAFFTFDGLGYGLVLGIRDIIHLTLPPTYGYADWLQEPLYLKWQVMGLVPVLRYLPVLFAFCLAAILYVFCLRETYRVCVVILLVQWVLTLVCTWILTFALSHILGAIHDSPDRTPTRPTQVREAPADAPAGEPATLAAAIAGYKAKLAPALEWLRERVDDLHGWIDPQLDPLKEEMEPLTRHLPPVVQEFLDDGGWTWVILGLGVVALLGVVSLVRRFRHPRKRRRKRSRRVEEPHINLDEIGDALNEPAANQIAVRDFPGRLRLVVMAPASSYVGDLLPEMAEPLLDWIRPGLGAVHENDVPRVVVWPRFTTEEKFTAFLGRVVRVPEAAGKRTPWVVLSGTTHLGRQRVYLGLAVHLDKTGYLREVRVERDKWGDVLNVRPSEPE